MNLLMDYRFRLALFIVLCALLVAGNILFSALESGFSRPKTISFEMPFPKNLAEKYIIKKDTRVVKVILAGFFSDWAVDDDNYLMDQERPGIWRITLPFDPGDNQYKFVVYLTNSYYPYAWVHDVRAEKQVDDNNGGLNSVVTVHTVKPLQAYFNIVIGGLAGILALYAVISFIIRALTGAQLSLGAKIVIYLALFGVAANSVYSIYAGYGARSRMKEFFLSAVNIINQKVQKEKAMMTGLENPENQVFWNNYLREVLWITQALDEKEYFKDPYSYLEVLMLDTNFTPRVLQGKGRPDVESNLAGTITYPLFAGLFNDWIFSEYRADYSFNPRGYKLASSVDRSVRWHSGLVLRPLCFLSYYSMVYPVMVNRRLAGYYAFYVRPGFPASGVVAFLVFNFILALVLAVPIALVFLNRRELFHDNIAGIDKIPDSFAKAYNITEREKEIILMVMRGLSNKEIAGKLFISRKTVDNHVYNIYQKFNVKSRMELANQVMLKSPAPGRK